MPTEEYLQKNRELAPRFIGRTIVSAIRLLFEPDDDEARIAWGPALVELDDGQRFLFDCEESLSNMIVRHAPEPSSPAGELLAARMVRPAIATWGDDDPLHSMLTHAITAIDVVSRAHDPEPGTQRYYEMCGWRIRFGNAGLVCVGTHLTTDCFPSTAFYLPSEVDPVLLYERLAVAKTKLIRVGFFRELRHGDPEGESLREAIQPSPRPNEARIVGYLRAGKMLVGTMGVTRDVLVDKGPIVGSPHVLTDGVYAWAADLAYYVERYHARVPEQLVNHMAANNWQVPSVVEIASLTM